MQAKLISEGRTLDYTPQSDVSAGDVIVRGRMVTVAVRDINSGVKGAVYADGVVQLPKAQEALADGAAVYWDSDGDPYNGTAGTGAITATETDNVQAGFVDGAADETDETVNVKLAYAAQDDVS